MYLSFHNEMEREKKQQGAVCPGRVGGYELEINIFEQKNLPDHSEGNLQTRAE